MNNITRKVLKKFCNIAQNEAKEYKRGGPPPCVGYLNQPKRPLGINDQKVKL